MEWIYKDEIFELPPETTHKDIYGFVYLITNLTNNRKYIGKKFFWSRKTLPITKTRKRRKKIIVESDWKTYYGSSNHLLKDIEQLGTENFKREILYLCKTKSECSYLETKEQFAREVLLTEEYYNGIINCRIGAPSVKNLFTLHS
jgi:hypothetical protein